MFKPRKSHFLVIICAFLFAFALFFYFEEKVSPERPLLASYSYQGPTTSVPGNPQFIQIQVLIKDSPEAGGVQIQNAEFNGKTIPLKPRDIYGNRGSAGFQVAPGKYKLKWVVQKSNLIWPRLVRHEEIVNVNPRDLWLQIEIVGDNASIR
ncbi:MAG: hypothetical protein FJZ64_04750 [Chlamydiae bacterium]|nr:hypothetical protein [Chlamydiota bacterium]